MIGTVIATAIAIYGGFTTTFLVGAVAYLGAGVLGARIARQFAAAGSGAG